MTAPSAPKSRLEQLVERARKVADEYTAIVAQLARDRHTAFVRSQLDAYISRTSAIADDLAIELQVGQDGAKLAFGSAERRAMIETIASLRISINDVERLRSGAL